MHWLVRLEKRSVFALIRLIPRAAHTRHDDGLVSASVVENGIPENAEPGVLACVGGGAGTSGGREDRRRGE
jgi:hypothetical protein